MKSFEQLNSSLSGDLVAKEPQYRTATKQLFESWSINVDRFVHNAVGFAKTLPGFKELPVDDQVSLIKYGRSEIASIVRFKHFNAKYDACIDYHTDTKALYVFPNKILSNLILSRNSEEAKRHTWAANRSARSLYHLDDMKLAHFWLFFDVFAIDGAIILYIS